MVYEKFPCLAGLSFQHENFACFRIAHPKRPIVDGHPVRLGAGDSEGVQDSACLGVEPKDHAPVRIYAPEWRQATRRAPGIIRSLAVSIRIIATGWRLGPQTPKALILPGNAVGPITRHPNPMDHLLQ